MKHLRSLLGTLLLGSALVACGGDDEIEVAGTYMNQFDMQEVITASMWGSASIADFDNDDNWAATQNPPDSEFLPNAYARVVWTEPADDGAFYYCTVAFGLDTLQMAQTSTQTADASDPDNAGCGGFPWTKMTPVGGE